MFQGVISKGKLKFFLLHFLLGWHWLVIFNLLRPHLKVQALRLPEQGCKSILGKDRSVKSPESVEQQMFLTFRRALRPRTGTMRRGGKTHCAQVERHRRSRRNHLTPWTRNAYHHDSWQTQIPPLGKLTAQPESFLIALLLETFLCWVKTCFFSTSNYWSA